MLLTRTILANRKNAASLTSCIKRGILPWRPSSPSQTSPPPPLLLPRTPSLPTPRNETTTKNNARSSSNPSCPYSTSRPPSIAPSTSCFEPSTFCRSLSFQERRDTIPNPRTIIAARLRRTRNRPRWHRCRRCRRRPPLPVLVPVPVQTTEGKWIPPRPYRGSAETMERCRMTEMDSIANVIWCGGRMNGDWTNAEYCMAAALESAAWLD